MYDQQAAGGGTPPLPPHGIPSESEVDSTLGLVKAGFSFSPLGMLLNVFVGGSLCLCEPQLARRSGHLPGNVVLRSTVR